MAVAPKVVHERPSIENTVLVDSYQSYYPARYSLEDDDKHVLHAGGDRYQVILNETRVSYVDALIVQIFDSIITLYILNSSFVLWSPSRSVGLELPYTLIALHALKETENGPALYLQIVPSSLFTPSTSPAEYIEPIGLLICEPESTTTTHEDMNETVYAPEHNSRTKTIHSLFPKVYTMRELYCALSTCSALHYESETETEGFNDSSLWVTKDKNNNSQLEPLVQWPNLGDADDLGLDPHLDNHGEAGMNIDVGETAVIGVRRRNSDAFKSTATPKARRVI